MKMLRFLAVAAFVASPVFADDALVKQLQRTEERLLKSIDGLSAEQWNFKAAPDRWSIAECVEHIAAAEPFIRGAVEGAMKDSPAVDGSNKDETILKFITDRSKKFKAPEPLVPTKRFASPADAVEFFRKERAATIEFAKGEEAAFRAHAREHPAFGALDAYGWLLFLSGHSERHTLQIEEVKADPVFPKV
jgi:DinB superfamily